MTRRPRRTSPSRPRRNRSFTISLIRKLVPSGPDVDKEFIVNQGQAEEKDTSSSDGGKPTQPDDNDLWDEEGGKLWDLSAIESQAKLMVNNLVLEVLLANLHVRQSLRAKEICIGILGNLACHKSLADAITSHNGLIATVVNQLFLNDSACLTETFRLLSTIFQSNASMSWAEALLPDEILSRIIWIIGNTVNSTLFHKTLEFLSALVDDQDVITILIEPLIKVGLVDCSISLLLTELEKSMDGNNLNRSDSLDSIFRLIEELSAIDNCSKIMSSNDQLIKALNSVVKLPDKFEVEDYCASVLIILANVLSDGEHLTPILSDDLPLLEGLFDILPLVSDDNEARNAFWCILTRLLEQVHTQESVVNSSKVEQFVSIFLAKFTPIKDDIETHGIQTEADSSVEGVSLKNGLCTSLRAMCNITKRWIADKSSLGKEDASLTDSSIKSARELLNFCRSAMGTTDL
ncbi:protein SAAL1 isoform X2 [Oryza brachyantha]|uniref:protein SAAL1 isoform X2 n=1 Tax=Oryza brachyantha TaxID=4533 RepID=UPI0007761943|nr:protein SAAL1 isoform X2 [Oryza brachyantha]